MAAELVSLLAGGLQRLILYPTRELSAQVNVLSLSVTSAHLRPHCRVLEACGDRQASASRRPRATLVVMGCEWLLRLPWAAALPRGSHTRCWSRDWSLPISNHMGRPDRLK
jgi:hypothetical protein